MLFRRLVLVLIISSLFSVGLSRRHGGNKWRQNEEGRVTDDLITESPITTQPGQPLTKIPDHHSNSPPDNGTTEENEIHSSKTHGTGMGTTAKLNVSKAEIGGPKPTLSVTGSKTEDAFVNKTNSNVGKNSTKDVPDTHLNHGMPNLKVDQNSTIFFNKTDSVSAINKTEGGVGLAVPDRQDLDEDDDLSYSDGGGITEMLSPASKGVTDIVNTFLTFWGPGQAWMSLKQILFFHIFVISIYYLLVNILGGIITLINLKRTPLLIYKEVKDFKEVKPVPAPVLPPPHKDYGYEGGFKTPKGENIKYVSYQEPHEGKVPEGPPKAEAKPGLPPDAGQPKAEGKPGLPPDAGPPKPPKKEAFHTPPSLAHQQGPVVPMGGGGAGHQQMSSYISYAGEVKPRPF